MLCSPTSTLRRTTIMLPAGLRTAAAAYAKKRGVSLGALIRNVLLDEIEGKRASFLDREIVFRGQPLPGAPEHHDDIYG